MGIDKDLQEEYSRARKLGIFDKDKELAGEFARAVKLGLIRDESGGTNYAAPKPQASAPSISQYSLPAAGTPPPPSTPQGRRPGVTFRQPSPKAASLYQSLQSKQSPTPSYDAATEKAIAQAEKAAKTRPSATPTYAQKAIPQGPKVKPTANPLKPMLDLGATVVDALPIGSQMGNQIAVEALRQKTAPAFDAAIIGAVDPLVQLGIGAQARLQGPAAATKTYQDYTAAMGGDAGAAGRAFSSGLVPAAGSYAGFSGGATLGAQIPGPAPVKAVGSLLGGMVGAFGGGASLAKLQEWVQRGVLTPQVYNQIIANRAKEMERFPLASSLGQAATALPFADFRSALRSPFKERAMEGGVEVLGAAGENLITGKPIDTADLVIQALSGAALPGENRLGRVFTGGGQRGAEAVIRGTNNVEAGARQFAADAIDPTGVKRQQAALSKSVMDAKARDAFKPLREATRAKKATATPPQATPLTSNVDQGVQPVSPSGTLKTPESNANAKPTTQTVPDAKITPVTKAIPAAGPESQPSSRGVVPSGAAPQVANQGGASVSAAASGSAKKSSSGLSLEEIAPEDLGILPGVQYKRGVNKEGVTDLLKGQAEYQTEHGGTLTAFRDADGKLYAVDGHHRRELAQRASKFTAPLADGKRVEVERKLQVQVLDAKDGWAQTEARAFGVLKNLRENKGVAIDAADALAKAYEPDVARSEARKLPQTPLARDVAGLVLLDEPGRALVRNKQVDGSVAAGIGEVLRGDERRQRIALAQAMKSSGVRSYDDGAALAKYVVDEEIVQKQDNQGSMFGDDEVGGTTFQSTAGEQAAIRGVVKKVLAAEQSSLLAVDKTEARAGEVFDTEGRRKEAGSVKDAKSKADALFEYDPEVKAALRQAASDVANGRISRDEGAKKVREVVLKAGSQTLAEIVKKGNAAAPVAEPSGGGLFGGAPAKAEEPKAEGVADMFADPEPAKKTDGNLEEPEEPKVDAPESEWNDFYKKNEAYLKQYLAQKAQVPTQGKSIEQQKAERMQEHESAYQKALKRIPVGVRREALRLDYWERATARGDYKDGAFPNDQAKQDGVDHRAFVKAAGVNQNRALYRYVSENRIPLNEKATGSKEQKAPKTLITPPATNAIVKSDPIERENPTASAPIGRPDEYKDFLTGKQVWDLTPDEITKSLEFEKTRGKQIEDEILGGDASEWRKMQNMANSTDDARARSGDAAIKRIEGKLTQEQVDRLYGMGEGGVDTETLQELKRDYSRISDSETAEELGRSIGRELLTLKGKTDMEAMGHKELLALARVRHATSIATEEGWDFQDVLNAALESASKQFGSAGDFAELMGDYLKLLKMPEAKADSAKDEVSRISEIAKASGLEEKQTSYGATQWALPGYDYAGIEINAYGMKGIVPENLTSSQFLKLAKEGFAEIEKTGTGYSVELRRTNGQSYKWPLTGVKSEDAALMLLHQRLIEKAPSREKTIAPQVLAGYPDLVKDAAPVKPETKAIEPAAPFSVGDMVTYMAPVVGKSPERRAGSVSQIMPDGRIEIRTQLWGYKVLPPSEVTKATTAPSATTPKDSAQSVRSAVAAKVGERYLSISGDAIISPEDNARIAKLLTREEWGSLGHNIVRSSDRKSLNYVFNNGELTNYKIKDIQKIITSEYEKALSKNDLATTPPKAVKKLTDSAEPTQDWKSLSLAVGDTIETESGARLEIVHVNTDPESVDFGDVYAREHPQSPQRFIGNLNDEDNAPLGKVVENAPEATPRAWEKSVADLKKLNPDMDESEIHRQRAESVSKSLYEKEDVPESVLREYPGVAADYGKLPDMNPWEMTSREYITTKTVDVRKHNIRRAEDMSATRGAYERFNKTAETQWNELSKKLATEHKKAVTEAIAGGKPVPEKVLAEYPSLVKTGATSPILQETKDSKQETKSNEPSTGANLERDRQNADTGDAVGTPSLQAQREPDNRAPGGGILTPQSLGDSPYRGEPVPSTEAPSPRKRSDKPVRDAEPRAGTGSEAITTGSDEPARSDTLGLGGLSPEPVSAGAVNRASDAGTSGAGNDSFAELVAKQKAAESVPVKAQDIDNIRETLPVLKPAQQDDVLFAENRFAAGKEPGVLFTNGTGTGKTAVALGIIKRFERQGKKNILAIAPSQEIIDAWLGFAPHLNLSLSQLDDTKGPGEGIVITTYANLSQNLSLGRRDWDIVLCDEAHKLISNKEGDDTLDVKALRAITLHPSGILLRTEMLYPELSGPLAEARAERLAAENNTVTSTDGEEKIVKDVERFDKADALVKKLSDELWEKRKIVEADVMARQSDRTKVVFLSATPFAYEKTTHYAEGYLFSYPKEDGSTRTGYNIPTGRNKFMVDNFGWSMKTGKLNQPSAEVDRALLQREFNNKLKREGALSGRALDVPFDYDRKFILAESAIGSKIDQGLKILWDDPYYRPLHQYFRNKFGFLQQRYLLEALKSQESIPIIRQHLALGRKVVLFHDYNKGGTDVSPFDTSAIPLATMVSYDTGAKDRRGNSVYKTVPLYEVAAKFAQTYPEYANLPIGKLKSPIEAIKAAFPDVLQINGTVTKKTSQDAIRLFQDDNSGRNIVIVQSDKGSAGISLHDTTGKFQRVLLNLGMPLAPTTAIQIEGRIFRVAQASDAIIRYITTGTNWERGTFAQVASKSGEAENLALGEGARALRDQFIQAYMDADTWAPGHEGEGTGGKEADNEAMSVTSAYDRAKTYYFQQQKKTSRTKAMEGVDYFATPEPIGFKMVEWLDPRKGESLLEPSAGHAAVARWFPLLNERTLVEPSAELSTKAMAAVPDARVIQGRFEDLHIVNKYHGIAMNPPFGSGGKTAIEHLEKAWGHLENGGRIVALLPTGPAADKRFDKWMNEIRTDPIRPLAKATSRLPEIFKGDTATGRAFSGSALQSGLVTGASQSGGWVQIADSETGRSVTLYNVDSVEPTGPRTVDVPARADAAVVAKIKLPSVAFERAGTSVATHIVILEKRRDYSSPTREIDLSDITDIKTLFGELENLGMGRRDARLVKSQESSLEKPITSATPKTPERRAKTAEEDELLESPDMAEGDREAYLPDDTGAALKAWQEQGVESPYFKRWFGDSEVVDESGAPLIVHHGSPDVRDIFNDGFRGLSRGSVFFAARDYATADSYADDRRAFDYQNAEAQTIPLYLSIKNPLLIDAKGQNWRETERYVQEAKDAGHDGIIIKNSVDFYNNKPGAKPTTVYAWFTPSQAKSALTGPLLSRVDRQPIAGSGPNRGTFSAESDNLLESPALPPGEREPSSLHMPATADFGGETLGAMIAPASARVKIAPIKRDGKPLPDRGKLIDALALATGRAVLVAKQKKGVAGSYRPSDARTSIKWYGDMETTPHEIGHAMDDNFGIVAAYSAKRQKSPWDAELFQQEFQATAKTGMTLKLRRAEAVAEWFRAYAMNRQYAIAIAPKFYAHVKATVPTHVLKAFDDFGTGVRRLAGAPATEAAMTHIQWGEGDQRSIREKLTEALGEAKDSLSGNQAPDIFKLTFADKLTANFQDSLRPVVAATDWARKLTGGNHLLPESDPILLMRLHADTVGKVGQMLDTGFVDYRGEAIIDPDTGEAIGGLPWLLGPISRPSVAETERLMKLTAIQGVAERQLSDETIETGIGLGLRSSPSMAKDILVEMSQLDQEARDSIGEVLRRYRIVSTSLLDYMVDSGRLSKEDADVIKSAPSGQHYISLQRVQEDAPLFEGSGKSRRLSKALATPKDNLKKRVGSHLQVLDPFVSLLDQTYKIVTESDRNRAINAFVNLFRSERALYEGGVVPLSQVMARTTTPSKNSIENFHNGEREHWEVNDKFIYAALKGIGTPAAPTGPLRILAKISAGIPRALITGNPAFAIRNFSRDMPERWMKDALGSKPWDSFKKFSDDEKERYALSGGTGMGHYTASRVEYAKAIKAVVKAGAKSGTIVRLPSSGALESYLKLLQAAEVQGRLPAYRTAFKHAKDKLGYDDYNAGLFAAGKAREIMDFAVSGNYLRALSPYIPFVNASVQGFSANYKALRRDPAKYLTKFLLLAAAKSLALAIMGMLGKSGEENLEEYRALPAYQRDLCINLPLPWADGWLAIPVGFEAASAAGAIERGLDYAMGNKDAYLGYFTTPTATQDDNYLMQVFHGSLVQSMLPLKPDDLLSLGGLPGAMNEMRTNYDTFRQRNIVPPYETSLPLAERKGASSASRAGKALAAILKTDPRAVDHLIGSTAGGTGRIVTTLSDIGREDKPLTGNRVMNMATGIVKEGPGYGSPQVQRTMSQLRESRTTPPLVLDRAQDRLKEAKTSPQLEIAKRELRKVASGPMPPAAINLTTAKRDLVDARVEEVRAARAAKGIPFTPAMEERLRGAIASALGQATKPLKRDETGVKTNEVAGRIESRARAMAPPGLARMGGK